VLYSLLHSFYCLFKLFFLQRCDYIQPSIEYSFLFLDHQSLINYYLSRSLGFMLGTSVLRTVFLRLGATSPIFFCIFTWYGQFHKMSSAFIYASLLWYALAWAYFEFCVYLASLCVVASAEKYENSLSHNSRNSLRAKFKSDDTAHFIHNILSVT
jgi:hypothetical protein